MMDFDMQILLFTEIPGHPSRELYRVLRNDLLICLQ